MKAIVVGAGVGGPAVALFLRRIGWEVEILEAAAGADREAGAFLNLATNGLAVVAELGLADRLLTDSHRAPQMVIWSGRGKRLGTVPNGPVGQPERGSVIVRRAWLHEVLADAVTAAGVPIRYNVRVADVSADPDGAVIRTAGGSTHRGDLVIGADGIGSVVRRFVAPEGPLPIYSGLVGLGGYAHGTGLAPTPDQQHFVFGRRSFFGYLVRDDGTVYWFANLTWPAARLADLRSVRATEWLDRLRDLHAEDASPVPEILAAADDTVGAYPIDDLLRVPRWHRDRTVLLGDAVHATSPSAGQGASLTLEDAQTLAQCLRDLPDPADPSAALATYQRVREPRTTAIVEYAQKINEQKRAPANGIAMAFRDLLLPMFLRRAARDAQANWVYEWQGEWSEPAGLP